MSSLFIAALLVVTSVVQPPPPVRRAGTLRSPPLRRAEAELECSKCLESGGEAPTFHQGLETFRVPMAMHAASRAKLAELMGPSAVGVALLEGGEQQTRYDTDHEPVFRQESYFQYLFGVSEAGCYGAISLPEGRSTLFVPRLGLDYEVFCGRYPSADEFRAKYAVDDVRYLDEMSEWLEAELLALDEAAKEAASEAASEVEQRSRLFLLNGLNTDSGNYAKPAAFEGSEESRFTERADLSRLFDALAEARVTKSLAEVEVMRYVNWVRSMAHHSSTSNLL